MRKYTAAMLIPPLESWQAAETALALLVQAGLDERDVVEVSRLIFRGGIVIPEYVGCAGCGGINCTSDPYCERCRERTLKEGGF